MSLSLAEAGALAGLLCDLTDELLYAPRAAGLGLGGDDGRSRAVLRHLDRGQDLLFLEG